MYAPCLGTMGTMGFRSQVRGLAYGCMILAQLWYEHEMILDRGEMIIFSQVFASNEAVFAPIICSYA